MGWGEDGTKMWREDLFEVGDLWETCESCGSTQIDRVEHEVENVKIVGGVCLECGAEHYTADEWLKVQKVLIPSFLRGEVENG